MEIVRQTRGKVMQIRREVTRTRVWKEGPGIDKFGARQEETKFFGSSRIDGGRVAEGGKSDLNVIVL